MGYFIFKQRLKRYEELIRAGDIQGAIKRMKNYDFETRKMGSTLDYLFGDINTFDMNMRIAIESLQKGDTQHALSLLNRLKESLKEIHHRAKLVAKEGFELE